MRSVITGSGAELAQPLQLASKRNRDESRCIKTLHQALLVSPPLKQFLAAFSSTTGIVLRFLHVGSGQRELLQALRRHAFCAALVNTEQERLRCIERLRDLLARVTGSGIPEKSASICGFSYFGVTLRARGSTVGTLLAGPVFYRTPAPKDWMRVLHRGFPRQAEGSDQSAIDVFRAPVRIRRALIDLNRGRRTCMRDVCEEVYPREM